MDALDSLDVITLSEDDDPDIAADWFDLQVLLFAERRMPLTAEELEADS
jgi:hypothetical protein